MKNRKIFIFFIALILLFVPSVVFADGSVMEKTIDTSVSINKVWNIKLTDEALESTVNSDTVYVLKDSTQEKVPAFVYLSYDKKIVTVTPSQPYEKSQKYTLFITQNVKNKDNKPLKHMWKTKFTTESSSQPVEFLSALSASRNDLYVNDEDPYVTFKISIKNSGDLTADDVKLYETDSDGNSLNEVASLKDDGAVDNGDDIANDAVFSARIQINTDSEKFFNYKVVTASDSGQKSSNVINIGVIDHITDSQAQNNIDLGSSSSSKFESLKNTESAEEAANGTVSWLKQQAGVKDAGISDGGIWYVSDNNILSGISINDDASKDAISRNSDPVRSQEAVLNNPDNYSLKISSVDSASNSKQILLLSPSFDLFSERNPKTIFEDELSEMPSAQKYAFVKKYNSEADVNAFKDLGNYSAIIVHTHGGTTFAGNIFQKFYQKVVDSPLVTNMTGEIVTADTLKEHEKDLKTGRLAIVSVPGSNYRYYAVTPFFIDSYNSNINSTVVYGGFCDSAYDNTMKDVYLDKGAVAYLGFSNTVNSQYNNNVGKTLFNYLIDDNLSIKDAYEKTIEECGSNDGDLASFKLYTKNDNAKLGSSDFTNGSFETGNINGWIAAGDVRIINKLSELNPVEGKYMALISTGLGSVSDSNSYLQQSFYVPDDALNLSFDYNVVSEEPMEYVDSPYDDKFSASIIDTNNIATDIASESINVSQWFPVYGVDFDGGDHTAFQTKWKHVDYDISRYRGQTITLKLHVSDAGDSYFDTASLIDNIQVM
ncbi:Ig-like domain-containing protein [Clostridium sp. LBM24168]